MTEKRFYIDDYGVINDKEYEFSVLGEDELVNIINGIVEENEQLKKGVHSSYDEHKRIVNSYCDKIKELEKENEQLKSENKRLYEENIRITQLITTAYNNERTQIGRNTIQQIMEQI